MTNWQDNNTFFFLLEWSNLMIITVDDHLKKFWHTVKLLAMFKDIKNEYQYSGTMLVFGTLHSHLK